jgi:hypothetical protein
VVNTTPRPVYPGERDSITHCIRGLGGHQERSGRVRKISPPPGFVPRTFQLGASGYTGYAVPVHCVVVYSVINFVLNITSSGYGTASLRIITDVSKDRSAFRLSVKLCENSFWTA